VKIRRDPAVPVKVEYGTRGGSEVHMWKKIKRPNGEIIRASALGKFSRERRTGIDETIRGRSAHCRMRAALPCQVARPGSLNGKRVPGEVSEGKGWPGVPGRDSGNHFIL